MLILFYDTETSDKTNNGRFDNGHQPYCLQIGAGLYDTDLEKFLHTMSVIIAHDPEIKISSGALSVHGINHETMAKGMQPLVALRTFYEMAVAAERMVGYNVGFDKKVMKAAYFMEGQAKVLDVFDKPHFDIMEPLTEVCKLPGRYGYKWPKLTEAYVKLIDPDGFDNAHDAFADIMATFELWKWCNENDITLKEI